MFLHIMVTELRGVPIISHMLICFLPILLDFAENQGILSDFKIQNSVRITECSDNGDSDNRGPTVYTSS